MSTFAIKGRNMDIKIYKTTFSALIGLLIMTCGTQLHAKTQECLQAKPSGPESVVINMYKNYPWSGRKVIKNEPKKILLKYFDENLTNLILRNNECEKKTGDICKIDFDIMYAAQDADISNFLICAMASDTKDVEVRFLNFGVLSIIHYRLTSTANGLRISDIIYSDGGSFAKFLSE